MTLSPGTRLGPYEILAPLGARGMGRSLPGERYPAGTHGGDQGPARSFSADPDRLRRFEQEARAAGVLNHPNITAVYNIRTYEPCRR